MVSSDLKVVSANVNVDNSSEADAKYKISASFRTSEGVVKGIDSGMVLVNDTKAHVASFYKNVEFEDSLHVTYLNEAASDATVQCEIVTLINEFVSLATAKAVEEAAE